MTSQASRRSRKQKGIAIIVTALSMMLIIPIVGLAIDASFLYAIRARMSAGADAAALAAARALNKGETLAEQEQDAINRALAFYNANFPPGFLATSNQEVNVTVAETAYRTRTVFVQASVDANVWFMSVLGIDSTKVAVEGKASRRDVNLMLVLDRSASMQMSNSCEPMKTAARDFIKYFANGRDRLGMITFGTSYLLAYPPSMDFRSGSPDLDTAISQISCTGGTGTAQGLWKAYEELQIIDEPGTLNLVVFFTDGLPNGITASFPVKQWSDTRYGYGADGYSSTSYQYSMEPSTCLDAEGDRFDRRPGRTYREYSPPGWNPTWTPSNKVGAITSAGNGVDETGVTYGVVNPEAISPYNTNETIIPDSGGCRFTASTWGYPGAYMRRDIAYFPDQDLYGNSTFGYVDPPVFTTGQYNNYVRPDKPISVGAVSKNAADNAARTMRRDEQLHVLIHAIGLGDPSGKSTPPDPVFMKRVANTADSEAYTDDEPVGMYVFAPDNTYLSQAFARVAGEILRISQ